MFNPRRLILGRKRRRLTARALAAAAGISSVTLSRLENGLHEPEDETVRSLAHVLSFPVGFFFAADFDDLPAESVSFRSLTSMTAGERDAALAAGTIAYLFNDWVEKRFDLPLSDIPDLGADASPEAAAQAVREHWALGNLPISNMVKLLEAKGVRVFSLCENTKTVDAFSCWRNDSPFVFLNTFKSAERSRFDAAHELGHLVMHRHGAPQESRQAEMEANQFAAYFLMPTDDIASRIRFVASIDDLVRAKKRWGVSVAALNYRLNRLSIISDWQNRSFNIEMASRGYRTAEPLTMAMEQSVLWPKVLSALWNDRVTREDIASDLQISVEDLNGLLFQIVGGVSSQAGNGRAKVKEALRLVTV